MRSKVRLQHELDFHPSNLKLTNEYYAKYEAISAILDANPAIVDLIHKDLQDALESTTQTGQDGTSYKYTSETVLRVLLCQIIENQSLRGVIIRIDDSHYLRRFARIGEGPMMDFTTLCKLKNAISQKTWKQVNKQLAKHAVENNLIKGEKLRLDTTAVETNIHWPTDSALLWDLYRVLARLIEQARRRVFEGQQVPNDEKLFSIFEPHTELLKRGKAGKDIEFGHMIQIQQVAQKFITDYEVYEHKPVEHQLLDPALRSHHELFGVYPDQLAADKGYYQNMEHIDELSKKVKMVGIAKKGKRTEEQTERESDPVFRHAQRFRAGVEGTISFLKRVLGLHRCLNKGLSHFVCTIGATVFVHNLLILARC